MSGRKGVNCISELLDNLRVFAKIPGDPPVGEQEREDLHMIFFLFFFKYYKCLIHNSFLTLKTSF